MLRPRVRRRRLLDELRQQCEARRGAKPSDLPIERLSKFEFIINLTTAKKLRLTVPASFQSLASELIE